MSDPMLTAVNQVYADHLKADLSAINKTMLSIRSENARTDNDTLDLIGTLESLTKHTKRAAEILREKLGSQMQEDGVVAMQSDVWVGSLARSPQTATITDESALKILHPELWEPQPDKLNRTELNKLARKGSLPGVNLSNGGAPVLRVSARKDV